MTPPSALDEQLMRRALLEAERAAAEGEVPVGAVLARGGVPLVYARNRREQLNDPVAHAEVVALSYAGRSLGRWRLNDCTLYVTLEPCTTCAGAMVNARLGRLVYGAPDPKAGGVRSLYQIADDPRLNHRVEVEAGLLAEESAALLRSFFRARRGKKGARA